MVLAARPANGEEAIVMAAEVQPDVIIVDINLPGIKSIETPRKIKASYLNIKIIGLSFLNDEGTIKQLYKAGASNFISKDQALSAISQMIRNVITCRK